MINEEEIKKLNEEIESLNQEHMNFNGQLMEQCGACYQIIESKKKKLNTLSTKGETEVNKNG